ncbi:MAG: HAMP domain-containing histidine kinase [Elusimicrobia bacterium]|nr:HAMP domain-containing histidine kinase [Elusimicrobiota bacterium]
MSVRLKLALILAVAMAGATAGAAAVFLHLQSRALVRADEERMNMLVARAEAAANEAVLSGDMLAFLDAIASLRKDHPVIASARVRLGGDPWRDVGESRPVDSLDERSAWVPGPGGTTAAAVQLNIDQGTAAEGRRKAYGLLLADALRSGGAAAAVGLLASILLSGSLTRRLVEIERSVAGLAEGRFDSAPEASGSDEIARLARGVREAGRRLGELDESKRTFVAAVTHELRAPLAAMRHHLKDLRSEGGLPESAAKRLESFERNLGRLEHFVTSLLETAKVARGSVELRLRPAALGPIVEDAAAFFASHAREGGLDLGAEVAADLPQARMDSDLVAQVIANLVSNAIKFTPRGGRVRVSARKGADGRTLELAVTDTGAGIPAEAQKSLFRPFERVKGTRGPGTGLGLALVKRVAELHGGDVRLDSAPGKGSTFLVRFPVSGPAASKA